MMKKNDNRMKFRSQTSDNMDRWKSKRWEESEKTREKERRSEKRREDQRRERIGKKVEKSRNTVFFQWFGAPEGRKVGSLKWRVGSLLVRREMKNCTPLWLETHFEVKTYKTHQRRSTFGRWDVEKVHAVVAGRTFRSLKCAKHLSFGALLGIEMFKKCTQLWRQAHFQVKMHTKHTTF